MPPKRQQQQQRQQPRRGGRPGNRNRGAQPRRQNTTTFPTRISHPPSSAAPSRRATQHQERRPGNTAVMATRREYWTSATTDGAVHSLRFCPGQSGLRHLDALGSIYDNYRVRFVQLFVQGVGPTTAEPNLAWAPDYRVSDTDATRDQILHRVPSTIQAAWQSSSLTIGGARVMRQRLLNCNEGTINDANTAFLLHYITSVAGTSPYWEIWAEYSVEFLNPSSGNA